MGKYNKSKEAVKLREKTLKNGDISLYLDIYVDGIRTYEFLKLYLKKSTHPIDKQHNKETQQLANHIKAKRLLETQSERHGLKYKNYAKADFLEYFESLMVERQSSKGNFDNWFSCHKHLKNFSDNNLCFGDLDEDLVLRFREHLLKSPIGRNDSHLSQNSAYSYFNKFRAAINQAFFDRLLKDNPVKRIKGIKQVDSKREYLTLEEVKSLMKTDCEIPILKSAFLFSCLTGLRWSDIEKLSWEEIEHSTENGCLIRFKMKKTKTEESLPISSQAYELIKDFPTHESQLVFGGLKYSAWYNLRLSQWMMRAGIKKHITFHCARHTFATLQLTYGTDIYTVSKLLGHSNLKTTEIYSKVIDQKKLEAVNVIPDII